MVLESPQECEFQGGKPGIPFLRHHREEVCLSPDSGPAPAQGKSATGLKEQWAQYKPSTYCSYLVIYMVLLELKCLVQ